MQTFADPTSSGQVSGSHRRRPPFKFILAFVAMVVTAAIAFGAALSDVFQ